MRILQPFEFRQRPYRGGDDRAAERDGLIGKESMIVERLPATRYRPGICLRGKGYRLTLTMPETMSVERRTLLRMLGAELVLTPGAEGMPGAIRKAEQLLKETKNAFMPQQFNNPPTRKSTVARLRWKSGRTRMAAWTPWW